MAIRSIRFPVLALALVALALGGCKRAEESAAPAPAPATPPVSSPGVFRVVSVDVGDAIDAGKRIPAPLAQFAPSDTIYASIASEGAAPKVTIVARWTYEDGQLVNQSSETIAPAATTRHDRRINPVVAISSRHTASVITAARVFASITL